MKKSRILTTVGLDINRVEGGNRPSKKICIGGGSDSYLGNLLNQLIVYRITDGIFGTGGSSGDPTIKKILIDISNIISDYLEVYVINFIHFVLIPIEGSPPVAGPPVCDIILENITKSDFIIKYPGLSLFFTLYYKYNENYFNGNSLPINPEELVDL